MAWYYGTYSCGHDGRVDIVGPTKDRQRKADWKFSGLCPECYKKHLEEEKERKNREAAEKSVEMEFPELTGTEKQVAWANTIRMKKFDLINSGIERVSKILKEKGLERVPGDDIGIEEISEAADYFIHEHTDEKWWIEHREDSVNLKEICMMYKKHIDDIANKEVLEEMEKEGETLTVSPDSYNKFDGVVKIKYKDSALSAEYVKNDDFINIVKGLGYKWNGFSWSKTITEYTGSADDRASELGNKLLLSGFTVQFPSTESKEMAVSGAYQPENDRWVKFPVKYEKLALCWKNRSDTLYDAAKKLPGARWRDGAMLVDIEFYREVLDFAETMGFSISKKAQEEIEKYKHIEDRYDTATATALDTDKASDEERIAKSLKSDGTIIEDLIDD